MGAQLVGALLGAVALFAILRTVPNITDTRTAFDTVAAGFGENSIIQVPLAGVLLLEVLGTALLVAVFLGSTSARNLSRLAAPFAVGLTMAVLLQFGQAAGNIPFNPARATASALFSSPDALGQLWLFWVARWWALPSQGSCTAGLRTEPGRRRAGRCGGRRGGGPRGSIIAEDRGRGAGAGRRDAGRGDACTRSGAGTCRTHDGRRRGPRLL